MWNNDINIFRQLSHLKKGRSKIIKKTRKTIKTRKNQSESSKKKILFIISERKQKFIP